MSNPAVNRLLDQLAHLYMGNQGNTLAHLYLEDIATFPLQNASEAEWRGHRISHERVQVFIPPKEEDRVLMFSDNSGVYVHSDGFCTPMGDDISHEVGAWQKVR